MKKRDLVLDFTSLLDVIMILLFVVACNMGQASLHAGEEARKQMEENTILQQELDAARGSLESLQKDYEGMLAGSKELQKQMEELRKENNLHKTEDIDKELLYKSLMEASKKITLICTPYINPNKSNANGVEITLYYGGAGGEQEAFDIVIFTHNFDLTREERIAKNAQMQDDMYRSLENIIKEEVPELVFITIVYNYGDKNFSQTDLNNIAGAAENLERNYSVTCYIDKVKQ